MKRPLAGLYFFLFIQGLAAQSLNPVEGDSIPSHLLDEIEISSNWIDPFVSETQLKKIPLDQTAANLTDLLTDQSTIYFRGYGNQQLSSISMRGTSPSQTQVLWHGLPVNTPSLGQTDFSTWPAWLIGSLAIHTGNSSSMYGSGAIGGAVLINESMIEMDQNNWSAQLQQGSFGFWSGGIKAQYNLQKWSFGTAVFGSHIRNNFSINSEKIRSSIRQPHAGVFNWGFNQRIQWQHKKQKVSAEIMHTLNDREVQPGVLALQMRNTLKSLATRSAISYEVLGVRWKSKTTVGIIKDETIFNDSLITPGTTLSMVHRSNLTIHPKWLAQLGGLIQQTSVQSTQLSRNATQFITEPFLSLVHFPVPSLSFTATGRGIINDNNPIQLVPSVQASWHPRYLVLHLQWSLGYRYPTLNDRFWIPGGNTDLSPEQSEQWELGVNWSNERWQSSFTLFQINAQDQIIWLPNTENLWSPINLRDTQNRGVEASLSYSTKNKILQATSYIAASYTQAILIPEQTQLPYVPQWNLQASQKLAYNHWELNLKPSFISRRFTSIGANTALALNGFFLADLSLSYTANSVVKNKNLMIQGTINNITNSYYELQSNLAMPGINYELQLTLQ